MDKHLKKPYLSRIVLSIQFEKAKELGALFFGFQLSSMGLG